MDKKMPSTLYSRFLKYIYLAIAIFIGGIIISFTGMAGESLLGAILPTTAVSLGLLFMAFWFRRTVEKKGFNTYAGICKKVNYSSVGLNKKKILSYLVETDDGYYQLPAIKMNVEIPEGVKVEFYCPTDVLFYEKEGVKILNTFYGYRIV
jgi:hypothetical protein